jgi:hypothetical protein
VFLWKNGSSRLIVAYQLPLVNLPDGYRVELIERT